MEETDDNRNFYYSVRGIDDYIDDLDGNGNECVCDFVAFMKN
jgi:hypothetical protein